ncbi:MAG: sugar phosphate isomerase/epimerase [Lachnospiraceae bacterium]|nr:sugar phosphate isomerase/epimerase [Lachnospiraceae bacterium]
MNRKNVLCSTGALIGRPNKRDYRLLKDLAGQLECDGFEFMVYDSWYPQIDEMIETVKGFGLSIPVVHCEKALAEKLADAELKYENGEYSYREMTPKEDKENFERAIEEFKVNLRIANEFGADRMVFHLWNGLISDRHIERNIERFGKLKDMAEAAGILLMVENVICNTYDPLHDMETVHNSYPDVSYVYDTKMAEFHGQTMQIFDPQWEWMLSEGHVRHLHINDYGGGIKDWGNMRVLPIGLGHVDFDTFFAKLEKYGFDGYYTVEATAFDKNGVVNTAMLNECFERLRKYF